MTTRTVDYETYILSADWVNRCRRYFGDAPRCAIRSCRRRWRDGVGIHHITYERLGRELKADLIPLCRGCHKEAHRWAEHLKAEKQMGATQALREGTEMAVSLGGGRYVEE